MGRFFNQYGTKGVKPQRGENPKDHTRGRWQILAGLAPQRGQWAECAGKKPSQLWGENSKDHTRGRGQILASLAPQRGLWAECAGKKPPQL